MEKLSNDYSQGVKTNPEIGCAWLKRAADRGDCDAQYNLGLAYIKGFGVEQNYVNAAKELSRASDQNVPAAQYGLACLYILGQGVPQDFSKAIYLMIKAQDSGYDKAGELMNSIRVFLIRYYCKGI